MSATPRFPYNSAQVFSYQVTTRPRSAPFKRATRPSSQRAALWRTTPARRQRAERAPKDAIPRSAHVDSESEEEAPDAHAAGQGEKAETRAARSWHIPDLQIRELVKGWEAEAATPEPVLPRAATASPSASQVNRPLLACSRRKRVPATPQRPMTCEPLVSEEPMLAADEEAEERARAEFEEAERQRIKYYFRDAVAAEQQPTVTEAELQRCASAPTGKGGTAKKRPALPRRNGELKQLEREAKAAKEDTRLTLNFVDTGDRYVVRVDPDLPIGPVPGQTGGDKPPSLKEIIEDISGIAPSQQILFCHRAKMGHDKYTLRSYHAHQHAQAAGVPCVRTCRMQRSAERTTRLFISIGRYRSNPTMWASVTSLLERMGCAKRAPPVRFVPQVDVEEAADAQAALAQAVRHGNAEEVRRLLAAASSLAQIPGLLHMAVNVGEPEAVRALLTCGAPTETSSSTGATALHVAATKDGDKIVLLLLEASAQVDACTMKQQTPLMMAARVGSVAVVQALLDHGASADKCSADGEMVVHMASGASTDAVLRLLLDRGMPMDARTRTGQTALHCAAEAGNLAGLRLLLARRADLEVRATNEGATALHTAARRGHAEVVRELIHAGADLEAATTANGYTPLHFTAFTGSSAACSVLLEAKATVDTQVGISGETALHLASMSGHAGVAKHLLAAGATKDAENASGLTPLLMAIMYDQSGTVTPCLLEASANVHATWRLGSTALHEAAQRADATTVAKLLDLKAAVDVQDTHGDRPLHSAAAGGHVETSRLLLERRAAIDAANVFGLTPLHAAAFNDCGDVLSLLLDLGSQAATAKDQFKETPAHLACSEPAIRRLLLPQGLSKDTLEGRIQECLASLQEERAQHCPALDPGALGLSPAWADAADATLTPLERRLLVFRDIENVSPGALIRELARVRRSATFDRRVRSLLVDSDAAVLQKAAVLPAEACQTLCQEVDQKASLRGGRTDSMPEFTLHLSRGELEGLIGKGLVASLFATAATYRKERGLSGPDKEMEIFLRKYSASTRPWIKMHADIATVTANVALSDEEGAGGQLLGFVGGRIHPSL
eukprot:s3361_g1.t1